MRKLAFFLSVWVVSAIVLASVWYLGEKIQPKCTEIEVIRKVFIPQVVEVQKEGDWAIRELTIEEYDYYKSFSNQDDHNFRMTPDNVILRVLSYNGKHKSGSFVDAQRNWLILVEEK